MRLSSFNVWNFGLRIGGIEQFQCLELWIKNWWNTSQSDTLLTDIQEKRSSTLCFSFFD
uniref:Uncharacterized protein n=1 Tax=Aegilops tauschii subsp. strangulata TaxID=200361 RepID=A0A453GZ55_AEGTS